MSMPPTYSPLRASSDNATSGVGAGLSSGVGALRTLAPKKRIAVRMIWWSIVAVRWNYGQIKSGVLN